MQRKFHITLVAGLVFLAVTGLGTWQEMQMKSEIARLAQIGSRMEMPPVPMPEKMDTPAEWDYRRVTLAGQFLYGHEFRVGPRALNGVNGYHMLVPFQRASGGIVMVDRGWISDVGTMKASRPAGMIKIEGIVQAPHAIASLPPNDPRKNEWHWADINAMAEAAKLKASAPVVVVISGGTPGVYPAGGKVAVSLRTDYGPRAVYWYMLALTLLGIFSAFHFRKSQPA